jgi:hypothetical protein
VATPTEAGAMGAEQPARWPDRLPHRHQHLHLLPGVLPRLLGFALLYLRGISDTLFKNKSLPAKVESRDIYLGAIPWVSMQLILVVIVIFFPQTVTAFLDKEKVVDINQATETLQERRTPTTGWKPCAVRWRRTRSPEAVAR